MAQAYLCRNSSAVFVVDAIQTAKEEVRKESHEEKNQQQTSIMLFLSCLLLFSRRESR